MSLIRGQARTLARPDSTLLTLLQSHYRCWFNMPRFRNILLVPLLPQTILSFPLLVLFWRSRKHLRAEIAEHTANAVVPGVLFIWIAHHVLCDLAEFLKQFPICVDALIRKCAHGAIPPPDIVALRSVGVSEGGESVYTGTNRAGLW